MQSKERRTFRRQKQLLQGELELGARRCTFLTQDVSAEGALVHSEKPLFPGQSVHIFITLPDDTRVGAYALVTRVRSPMSEDDSRAMMALRFVSWDEGCKDVWLRHLARGARSHMGTNDPLHFEVTPENLDVFMDIFVRQIRQGGLFMDGAVKRMVGAPVKVTFVHPENGSRHTLHGVVGKKITGTRPGMVLRFVEQEQGWKVDFLRFMGGEPIMEVITGPILPHDEWVQ